MRDRDLAQLDISAETPLHPEIPQAPRSIAFLSDLDAVTRFLDSTGVGVQKGVAGHFDFWPSDQHPEVAHARVLRLSPEENIMLEDRQRQIAEALASLPQEDIPVVICLRTCRDIINRILGSIPSDQPVPFCGFFDAQK